MDIPIACFDLETTGFDADFDLLLCAVIKPWGGKPLVYREDTYVRDQRSHNPQMVRDIVEQLNSYPILIGHNAVKFDRRFLNATALMEGAPVLDPRGKLIDPVLVARRHLKFSSNRLEALCEVLETKVQKGKLRRDVWRKAGIDADKGALDYVVAHCILDVRALEEVTKRLWSFIPAITSWGSHK